MPRESNVELIIKPPNLRTAVFEVIGTAPLVIHRFSVKAKAFLADGQEEGKSKQSKKNRKPRSYEDEYHEARYIAREGWDGFPAGAIRSGMISACRLVDFKMTLAKLSIFVVQDGWDKLEPQIPLIRIYGEPQMQKDTIRNNQTGGAATCVRPVYFDWKARITIRWDNDQFTINDIMNLLHRVGEQVGIGAGRPDSRKSCGMGWGTFMLGKQPIKEKYGDVIERPANIRKRNGRVEEEAWG